MIEFHGRAILLDIEGTTSSVRFVYDVLFPYARQHLGEFLARNWDRPDVAAAREQIARDAGAARFATWLAAQSDRDAPAALVRHLHVLMDADAKATGLKALQGLIWREGYDAGHLKSHVYEDVPPALDRWTRAGLDIRIYSSGSVEAQRVFFSHTDYGDLTRFLKGHYDTQIGPKQSPASYTAIAADIGIAPGEILFLSDVVAELDAARIAGMATGLVVRPGNKPVSAIHTHATTLAFEELTVCYNETIVDVQEKLRGRVE